MAAQMAFVSCRLVPPMTTLVPLEFATSLKAKPKEHAWNVHHATNANNLSVLPTGATPLLEFVTKKMIPVLAQITLETILLAKQLVE